MLINSDEIMTSAIIYLANGMSYTFTPNSKQMNLRCLFVERDAIQRMVIKTTSKQPAQQTIPVSSISLSPSQYSGAPGEQFSLSCSIYPSNASNKSITWVSTDSSVATIDTAGIVRLLGVGTCSIAAIANDGSGVYGECFVTVKAPTSTSIILSPSYHKGTPGTQLQLTPTFYPAGTSVSSLSWSSSNNSVASVDGNGMVYLNNVGTCTITAHALDGSGLTGTATIDVAYTQVSSITLNYSYYEGTIGQSLQLVASVSPMEAHNKSISWSSSNNQVASVDANGMIKFNSIGNCVITATAQDGSGISASCSINVTGIRVAGIYLDRTYYEGPVGNSFLLTPTIIPQDAQNKTISWSSSNDNIASVNSQGYVTMHSVGECVIFAKSTDGGNVTASCNVKVLGGNSDVSDAYTDDPTVSITTVTGQTVYNGLWNQYIWNSLPKGVYIIKTGTKLSKRIK